MALSQIIKQICPAKDCGKVAVEVTRVKLGNSHLITLQCGHLVTEGQLTSEDDLYNSIISSDGMGLMPYQIEGIKRIEQANGRAILADMQGLGKTVQICGFMKLHEKTVFPALGVVPASVARQWFYEIRRWWGKDDSKAPLVQVISSGKERAAPGFDIYIVTYDMLKNEDMFKYVDDIKFVFIDECQRIKNHLSDRAKAVQRVAKNVEHIVPMSGTPIKNHAGEYFTVLNLVQPKRYPHYERFIKQDCDSYESGWGYKIGGLKNPAKFAEDTKDFIIRRTKDEVLKDLPEFTRRFQHVELDGKVKAVYVKLLKELDELMYADMGESERNALKIVIMTKMRKITGISKVAAAAEWIQEYMESTDRKLGVFIHHEDVMNLLTAECNSFLKSPALQMVSSLNQDKRHNLTMKFKDDNASRLLIASTQCAGEGINLQFCSDALMLERQWNPANEEQAESRFHRYGQKNKVVVNYMIVSETIDEYFTELVEQKRAIVAGALDNKEIQWNENNLMADLAMVLVTKGKKAWKL
jgi:SNF2 family DNA or RNA helicase